MSSTFVRGKNRADGQRTLGGYIGDALRHGRRAAELNLKSGPTAGVAAAVQQAREALEGATWVCQYVALERDQ